MYDDMERIERIRFTIGLNRSKYNELKEIVNDIEEIKMNILDGDTLTIEYDLSLLYFDCVKQLAAILNIAKIYGKEVVSCKTEELEFGESLIEQVLTLLHDIRIRIDNV